MRNPKRLQCFQSVLSINYLTMRHYLIGLKSIEKGFWFLSWYLQHLGAIILSLHPIKSKDEELSEYYIFEHLKISVIVALLQSCLNKPFQNNCCDPVLCQHSVPSPKRLHIPAPIPSFLHAPTPLPCLLTLKESLHISKFTGFLDYVIRDNMGNFLPNDLICHQSTLLCLVTLDSGYFNLHWETVI